jgi:hypothetical protein
MVGRKKDKTIISEIDQKMIRRTELRGFAPDGLRLCFQPFGPLARRAYVSERMMGLYGKIKMIFFAITTHYYIIPTFHPSRSGSSSFHVDG